VRIVEEAHVAPPQRLHHRRRRPARARRDEEMDVVRHEHVGVHGARVSSRGAVQAIEVKAPVGVSVEACRAVVAALDHVQRHARQLEPRRTRPRIPPMGAQRPSRAMVDHGRKQ
jgi:hypothetical protein